MPQTRVSHRTVQHIVDVPMPTTIEEAVQTEGDFQDCGDGRWMSDKQLEDFSMKVEKEAAEAASKPLLACFDKRVDQYEAAETAASVAAAAAATETEELKMQIRRKKKTNGKLCNCTPRTIERRLYSTEPCACGATTLPMETHRRFVTLLEKRVR